MVLLCMLAQTLALVCIVFWTEYAHQLVHNPSTNILYIENETVWKYAVWSTSLRLPITWGKCCGHSPDLSLFLVSTINFHLHPLLWQCYFAQRTNRRAHKLCHNHLDFQHNQSVTGLSFCPAFPFNNCPACLPIHNQFCQGYLFIICPSNSLRSIMRFSDSLQQHNFQWLYHFWRLWFFTILYLPPVYSICGQWIFILKTSTAESTE